MPDENVFIVLAVDWDLKAWIASEPSEVKLAYLKLLCYVKKHERDNGLAPFPGVDRVCAEVRCSVAALDRLFELGEQYPAHGPKVEQDAQGHSLVRVPVFTEADYFGDVEAD